MLLRKGTVSEFEAMANDLRDQLLRLPATPRRKADMRHLSFQRIIQTNDALNNWFGFEMLKTSRQMIVIS